MIDLTSRFNDSMGDNVVESFNKLHVLLKSYVDSFENLRYLMLQQSHFLNSFPTLTFLIAS